MPEGTLKSRHSKYDTVSTYGGGIMMCRSMSSIMPFTLYIVLRKPIFRGPRSLNVPGTPGFRSASGTCRCSYLHLLPRGLKAHLLTSLLDVRACAPVLVTSTNPMLQVLTGLHCMSPACCDHDLHISEAGPLKSTRTLKCGQREVLTTCVAMLTPLIWTPRFYKSFG